MAVAVTWQGGGRPALTVKTVQRLAERMLGALRLEQAELSVMLCGDAEIHALNRAYRHQDRPTDVLAFAMREGPGPVDPLLLGDVVLSLETCARQAEEHGRTLLDEATLLLAHGLLHLLGMDHRDRTEERRMSARTDLLRAAAQTSRRRVDFAVDNPRARREQVAVRGAVKAAGHPKK